jgi:hypothetical protein
VFLNLCIIGHIFGLPFFEKTGETLFTTKCDEIKTQSESYTLNKEELINDIKSMIEKDKTTKPESL